MLILIIMPLSIAYGTYNETLVSHREYLQALHGLRAVATRRPQKRQSGFVSSGGANFITHAALQTKKTRRAVGTSQSIPTGPTLLKPLFPRARRRK